MSLLHDCTPAQITALLRERVQAKFDAAVDRNDFDKACMWALLIEELDEEIANGQTESEGTR
jgi:hypothetical protein